MASPNRLHMRDDMADDVPEMVMRVAKALYFAQCGGGGMAAEIVWREFNSRGRGLWYGIASAGIEAMREPTEEMLKALAYPNTDWNTLPEECYRIMIDAALGKHQ